MKKDYQLLFVVITCLVLSFIHCPLFEIFFDDKEIFKYTGFVIAKGGVPYRDFFDHKPPLIFLINYLGLLLGGWGLWMIDTLLVLLASILFFKVCRKYQVALAWVLPALFNLMIRNNSVSVGIGMTRAYAAIFLLIGCCLILSDHKYRFYLIGIICGLIFFVQQDQVLPLLPYLLWAVFTGGIVVWTNVVKRVATLAAGFLTVALPIVIYFWVNHSLVYFWDSAFLFNFEWYSQRESLVKHAKAIRNALHDCEYDVVVYASLILGVAAVLWDHKKKWLLVCSIISVQLSFCSEYVSGKLVFGLPVSYYFLPLAATVPFLLFVVFAFTENSLFTQRRPQILFGLILSVNLFFHLLQYAVNVSPNRPNHVATSAQFQYLKKQPLKDYEVYVFYNSNFVYLYNQFRILSPSRWIYHYFWHWYDNWDANSEILHSIVSDLQQHHTKYVVDFSNESTFKNKGHFSYWKSFLSDNYVQVSLDTATAAGGVLWQLKQTPQ